MSLMMSHKQVLKLLALRIILRNHSLISKNWVVLPREETRVKRQASFQVLMILFVAITNKIGHVGEKCWGKCPHLKSKGFEKREQKKLSWLPKQ